MHVLTVFFMLSIYALLQVVDGGSSLTEIGKNR